MSGFPDEVEAYYCELARSRGWSPDTEQMFRATVELIRDLDRGTAARTYGARADDDGTDWLYEAVWHEREWVVVRQLQVTEDGTITRYWWQRLEDEHGGLTDQALDRDAWDLRPLERDDFYAAWDTPEWSLTA
ncbi:hypothetical protein Kfla_4879 [Kribbella flavida DSM 17836]|uniref:Uncharacterized protein n=1 Tax=Kribbella flavida (strain DSM 17836 / JCM 10339 / NBRC 14399) TaxID=479435 RepID=D2Q0U5_KRIFD|nr:hypothetical protein [Kribbella flavida]ADB33895.1 hypothetical protein Kfla_4879 [Kribbella flavida DSM 17836]